VSIVAAQLGGGPQLLLIRESFVTGALAYDANWALPRFRRGSRLITFV
jgi:hypothetical protein